MEVIPSDSLCPLCRGFGSWSICAQKSRLSTAAGACPEWMGKLSQRAPPAPKWHTKTLRWPLPCQSLGMLTDTASLPAHCSALKGPCATWHCSPGHSTEGTWGRNVAVTPDSCPLPQSSLKVGRSVLDEGDLSSQAELCGATKQFLHFQN